MADDKLLHDVCSIVARASLAVAAYFKSRDFDVTDKGGNDPLTSADLRANEILQAGLRARLPNAGWLSEESEDDSARLKCSDCWVVDPIDGTREFVAGVPEFSVSVGLARAGLPVMGWVALPAEDRLIYGGRDVGVWQVRYQASEAGAIELGAPEACVLSDRSSLPGSRLLVSQSEARRGAFESVSHEFELAASGSIARKLALVAAGQGDLNVSLFPKNEWDICGGVALMAGHSRGAYAELQTGNPQQFNQPKTRTFGLAAGPEQLVSAFVDYLPGSKLRLAKNYS